MSSAPQRTTTGRTRTDAVRVGALWRPSRPEVEVIAAHWPDVIDFVPSQADGAPRPDAEALATCEVLVGLPMHLDAALLDQAPHLRLLHILGHGVDPLLVPEVAQLLTDRGVTVARTACASTAAAEYTLMALVALARRIAPMHHGLLADGSWAEDRKAQRMAGGLGGELSGKRLLVVGYGGIGRELAPRAKAFGMEVTVLRRHPATERAGPTVDRFAGFTDLDVELPRAHHVVLAVPLTPETRGLLDESRVSSLAPGACVVNIARGEVADEAALLRGLESGWLGGLALDVWHHEHDRSVPLPGPRWQEHNLLATPHISGLTFEARLRALEAIGESLRRYLRGEKLVHEVDLDQGY